MGSTHPHKGHATRPLVGAVCLLLAVIAALIAGCGSSGEGTDQTSSSASAEAVTIQDYIYEPASITVPKGTTVSFTNRDSTPHTATSKESGLFESGSIDTAKTGKITLEESGTFAYYCLFHPFMKGTIVVE